MEPVVWSVYCRSPEKTTYKILVLLTPVSKKLSYTPTGMQLLKLTPQTLPSFEQMVALLSIKKDLFAVVPYEKGRTQLEIHALIYAHPIVTGVQDVDVISFALYKGKYGNPGPVRSRLLEQGIKNISLTFTPASDPLSEVLGELSTMDLEQNRVYKFTQGVLISPPIDSIEKGIYLLSIAPDSLAKEQVGHALVLIVTEGVVEVIDSAGYETNCEVIYEWVELLPGKKIYSKQEVFCPQATSVIDSSFQGEGHCLIWAYWYIQLLLLNPGRSGVELRRYLQEVHPSQALEKISRLATSLYS